MEAAGGEVSPRVVLAGWFKTCRTTAKGPLNNRLRPGYHRLYSNGLITFAENATDSNEQRVNWIRGITSAEVLEPSHDTNGTEESTKQNDIHPNLKLKFYKGEIDIEVPGGSHRWASGISASASLYHGGESKDQTVLYEDSRVKLFADRLVINWYFFPFGNSKTIPITAIQRVEIPQSLGIMNAKSWGMALDFEVWWARSIRLLAHLGVHKEEEPRIIIRHCRWPSVGFSCSDREALMAKLRDVLAADKIKL